MDTHASRAPSGLSLGPNGLQCGKRIHEGRAATSKTPSPDSILICAAPSLEISAAPFSRGLSGAQGRRVRTRPAVRALVKGSRELSCGQVRRATLRRIKVTLIRLMTMFYSDAERGAIGPSAGANAEG
ncbi:unnamed protein product, partial [Iphiclides podalirius]